MITFEDVRVEQEKTCTFMPPHVAYELSWFLKQNGIEHRLGGGRAVRDRRIPEIRDISEEEISAALKKYEEIGESAHFAGVIISHLNVEDLTEKALNMCQSPEDPDYAAAQKEESDRAMEGYLLNEAEEEDFSSMPEKKAVDYLMVVNADITLEDLEKIRWNATQTLDAKAQYYMGVIYENGYGVEKDFDRAETWYRIASRWHDYAEAQYNLGLMYENEIEGRPYIMAEEWYRKAAEQGHEEARQRYQILPLE